MKKTFDNPSKIHVSDRFKLENAVYASDGGHDRVHLTLDTCGGAFGGEFALTVGKIGTN